MQELFTTLDTAKSLGRFSSSETLAVRLTPLHLSTARAQWVKVGKELQASPLEVFPDADGALKYVFCDTVVIAVPTPLTYLERVKEDGTTEVVGQPTPTDPGSLSPLVQSLFGVKGEYHVAKITKRNYGVQLYRISTCNLPVDRVVSTYLDIQDGKYCYLGKPIEVVRLDLTSNLPGAIEPSEFGSKELIDMGWEYKKNRNFVGDCCHTYVTKWYSPDSPKVETKIYDKFRYMLEVGAVAKTVGDNLANILDSNQDNIRKAFYSKDFQENGFGRVETRFFGNIDSLESILNEHLSYVGYLVASHSVSTSFQESWDSFLQPNHYQTAVLVHNLDTNEVSWTFARWVNRLTDKVNGFSGLGEAGFYHALKHYSMGNSGINAYSVKVSKGQATLVATACILPDNLHTALLNPVGEGKVSKASVVSSKLTWDAVGLAMPFSLAPKCGKGRKFLLRGIADLTSVEEGTLASVKTIEAKAKKAEALQAKRLQQQLAKVIEQVEKDKYETAPQDWKKHKHISELAGVAKPICTRYYFAKDLKYPCYMLKVGKKWYKANSKLNRMLDQTLQLPLVVEVWDSNREYNGSKVWEVNLKPLT